MIKIVQGYLRPVVQHFNFQNISFRKGITLGDPHWLGWAIINRIVSYSIASLCGNFSTTTHYIWTIDDDRIIKFILGVLTHYNKFFNCLEYFIFNLPSSVRISLYKKSSSAQGNCNNILGPHFNPRGISFERVCYKNLFFLSPTA